MALTKNGVVVDKIDLLSRWKTKSVYENNLSASVSVPKLLALNNLDKAISMLYKHVKNNSLIALHTDVDMDGVGCTYIMQSVLKSFGANKLIYLMNGNKEHGIKMDSISKINNANIDLLVITDSSTNNIEEIKKLECDVLVIDHHDVKINDFYGYTNDGQHVYTIVNNNIENKEYELIKCWLNNFNCEALKNIEYYKPDNRMSCGLVVYELLRVFCILMGSENLLSNLMLFQWVGVTLFTDAIDLKCERNQWYIQNTVENKERERTINVIMSIIAKYKFDNGSSIDKSFINYTFAPIINKTIRANKGSEALDIIINRPQDILELKQYEKLQEDAINMVLYTDIENKIERVFTGKVIICNTNGKVNKTYNGVIAGRIVQSTGKNCVVYSVINGKARGSFRGRYPFIDYRSYFDEYSETSSGDGHPPAFGFTCNANEIINIMNTLDSIEPKEEIKPLITVADNYDGVYHADNMEDITKNFNLALIAIGNSRVISTDEIRIQIKSSFAKLIKQTGKVYNYDVFGLECKAFNELVYNEDTNISIYSEYSKEIVNYIK